MFEQALWPFLADWLDAFLDPRKRIWWGYLLCAFLMAFVWLAAIRGAGLAGGLRVVFSRASWWSRSARADYLVMAINGAFMAVLSPRLLGQATIAYVSFDLLHGLFDGRPVVAAHAPGWSIAAGFTLFLFLLDDFARYWVHRCLHTVPALWAFHRVHHSATALNPFTVFRIHPVEAVLFSLRGALVHGVGVAVFFFAFGDRVTLVTVLGASVLTFAFNALGSNLRHSNVSLGFWRPVERIVMSPAQHHVHHSCAPEHRDRNFGVALALWDWLFGTHCHSLADGALRYGLREDDDPSEQTLRALYFRPFAELARALAPRRRERADAQPTARDVPMRPRPLRHRAGATVSGVAIAFVVTIAFVLAPAPAPAADDVVNIYSARKEELILPLLERFEAETGMEFRLVTGKADGLLKRLEIEGELSPADVFITVDAGRLQRAKDAGVLQPVENATVEAAIPANLRDRDGYWFGVSQRARTIVYAKDRVDPAELSTYGALADPKWKGRLCIRSSSSIYNQSLVASMIEAIGVERTEAWARGLVANLVRPPAGGDTDQLLATAAGQCDVTVVNTYYLGRLVDSDDPEERAAGEKLAIFWPNQGPGERGVHVNVSGAGITAHARHVEPAHRLLEFLVTKDSQAWYAEVNHEYPVVPGTPISDTLKEFGSFKADDLNLSTLGENNPEAVKLMDRAGWR